MGSLVDEMRTCAELGAERLEAFDPLWHEKINLERLDMSSCRDCVLGQRFQEFTRGVMVLFPDEDEFVCTWGFDLDSGWVWGENGTGDEDKAWRMLEGVWVDLIKARYSA